MTYTRYSNWGEYVHSKKLHSLEVDHQRLFRRLRTLCHVSEYYLARDNFGHMAVMSLLKAFGGVIPDKVNCQICNTEGEIDACEYCEEGLVHCEDCGGYAQWNCGDCGGGRRLDCRYCQGSGQRVCDFCGGDKLLICPECKGHGKDDNGKTCYLCGGEGSVECGDCDGDGEYACEVCMGEGQRACSKCMGEGVIWCEYCNDGWCVCGECEGAWEGGPCEPCMGQGQIAVESHGYMLDIGQIDERRIFLEEFISNNMNKEFFGENPNISFIPVSHLSRSYLNSLRFNGLTYLFVPSRTEFYDPEDSTATHMEVYVVNHTRWNSGNVKCIQFGINDSKSFKNKQNIAYHPQKEGYAILIKTDYKFFKPTFINYINESGIPSYARTRT